MQTNVYEDKYQIILTIAVGATVYVETLNLNQSFSSGKIWLLNKVGSSFLGIVLQNAQRNVIFLWMKTINFDTVISFVQEL